MKNLIALQVTSLRYLDLVQFLRDSITDIKHTEVSLLSSDLPLAGYLKRLEEDVDSFEEIIRNPQKNPYTDLLQEKDKIRDAALNRFGRKLSFYELSEDAGDKDAYSKMTALWKVHGKNARLNYQAQTSATDNLLNDLQKEPYATAAAKLDMQKEIDGIKASNDDFRLLADDKRAEEAGKEYCDAKEGKNSLTNSYSLMATYIEALAKAYEENAEWDKLLKALNVARKNYGNMLARR